MVGKSGGWGGLILSNKDTGIYYWIWAHKMNLLFQFPVIILFRSQIKMSEAVTTRRTSPLKEIKRRRCSSPSAERGT